MTSSLLLVSLDILVAPIRKTIQGARLADVRLLQQPNLETLPLRRPDLLIAARDGLGDGYRDLKRLWQHYPDGLDGVIVLDLPWSILVLEAGGCCGPANSREEEAAPPSPDGLRWRRAPLGKLPDEVVNHFERVAAIHQLGCYDFVETDSGGRHVQTEVRRGKTGEIIVYTTVFESGVVSCVRTAPYPMEGRTDLAVGRCFVQQHHRSVFEEATT